MLFNAFKLSRMKHFLIFTFAFLFAQYTFAQTAKDKHAILAQLSVQENAWNKGDLKTFMQTYWKNDSLTFVGSKGVIYGWDNTLRNYEKNYTDTTKMGKLYFDIIKVDLLDATHAFVIGAWHLKRSIGDLGGHYTLLFRKIDGQWVIAVDHSS